MDRPVPKILDPHQLLERDKSFTTRVVGDDILLVPLTPEEERLGGLASAWLSLDSET